MKPSAKSKPEEKPGRKGPAYPYYSWGQCVKLAGAVKALGGERSPVTTGDIAHQLQVAEDSAMLSQLIASARTYGFIEGRGEYTLTEDGKKYFFPTSESEKRRAELSLFTTPASHTLLVNQFDGGLLPPVKQIANVLLRAGAVPKSWAERAASLFKDACAKLWLVDGAGHLRHAVAVRTLARIGDEQEAQENNPQEDDLPPDEPDRGTQSLIPPAPRDMRPSGTRKHVVWTVPTGEGEEVRVETPERLSRALWEKLVRYVQILEPPESEAAQ